MVPSLGFGMGIERLLMVLEAQEASMPEPPRTELYLAPMGERAVTACFEMALRLREGGVSVQTDLTGRGLKAQMKYADKIGARFVIVVGDDELDTGKAVLKEMETGEQTELMLDELYTTLYNKALDRELAGMTDLFSQVVEEG